MGLVFKFAGGLDEGDVGDVQEHHVLQADFEGEFADGFEKGKAFDVAGGAADSR